MAIIKRISAALILFVLAGLVSSPVLAGDSASTRKLDRALRHAVETTATSVQPVIVRAKPGQIGAVRAWLKANGVKIESEQPGINAVSTKLRVDQLDQLAAQLGTDTLSLNAVVTSFAKPPSSAVPVNPAATVLRATLGLTPASPTGKGVGIAIIDTGIRPSTDLQGRFTAFYDFVSGGGRFAAAYDDNGHGTHVAGLIASSGALGNQFTGVAPGVHLIGMKVLDAQGAGRTSDVIDALAFAVANKDLLGIDIINLSLGHPIYESATTDPLVQAVEAASRAGIIVVTAAGNVGRNPVTKLPGYAGITSPGNAPSAITAGALDHLGTVGRGDDRVAPYSSAGPTWYDGQVKPDLLAPGHRLGSNAARSQTLYRNFPLLRIDANHMMLSGTSMASAVTTGAVAVMLEANRGAHGGYSALTPNAAKAVLQFTALRLRDDAGNDIDSLRQGAGALNVGGAAELARSINTAAPVGSWWLESGVNTYTTIGGQDVAWAQNIVWGTYIVRGTTVFENQPWWALNIVWGTMDTEGDNIVWGTMDTESDNIVWGTMDAESDNIVWGTNIVWGSGLIGETEGDNIVWGTAGPDLGSTAWGSLSVKSIIWGTNIVWGMFSLQ